MGAHDCTNPSHLWKLNWILTSTFFSSARSMFKSLRNKTVRDPILTPLHSIIISGWLDTFEQVPKPLRPCWFYRNELLSIGDDIILKGSEQIFIPAAMQDNFRGYPQAGNYDINDDIANCVAKDPI